MIHSKYSSGTRHALTEVGSKHLGLHAPKVLEKNTRRLILIFLCIIVVLRFSPARADMVRVPVNISYPFLNQLLLITMFHGPKHTAEILVDDAGCSKVILSEPILSGHGNALRLFAKAHTILGMPSVNDCISLMDWAGQIEILGRPVVVPDQSTVIGFQVQDFNLFNEQGAPLTSGIIWQSFRGTVHSLLGQFRVDFGPSIEEVKAMLPTVLPQHSAAQVNKVIDSLHLSGVQADTKGLTIEVSMEVEKLPDTGPLAEPTLTAKEMAHWEKQWESWDAFLTSVIKLTAAETSLAPVRAALLEILLDARYEFARTLSSDHLSEDPVRRLFVRSWQRLTPLLQEIYAAMPGEAPLAVIAFLTAGDALQALDGLGPALGLEISADGLRRLARLLNDKPGMDPLRYVDEVDPELRGLFGFENIDKEPSDSEPLKLNYWFIRPAFAGTSSPNQSWARLNNWIPSRSELDQYLPLVRDVLSHHADSMLTGIDIDSQAAAVYQNLVLAAAWQESCWRQYITEKRKLVPLRSYSGDVGLMQINERVWRGFYAGHKLKWDINYNVRAGCEILLKYLVDYALPKGEHKKGNVHYLARAVYSAYNGGPSQLSRYRNPKTAPMLKEIDAAFWKKYQAVQKGKEYNVAECLGGTPDEIRPKRVTQANKTIRKKAPTFQKASKSKSPGPAGLKQDRWILAQNPKHFTLQIMALNSEQSSKDFILEQPHPEQFAYYRLKSGGKTLYAIIYGNFAKLSDAEKASIRSGHEKPWIRDFATVQKIIKK